MSLAITACCHLHLALIDITRRLIVIRERDKIASKAEQSAGMQLLMHRDARLGFVRIDNNGEEDLLKDTYISMTAMV